MANSNIGQECFKLLKNTFKFNDYKSGLQAQAVKKIAAGMYLTSDIWGWYGKAMLHNITWNCSCVHYTLFQNCSEWQF